MTQTEDAPKPDLGAVKQRQQQAWASGDFAVVAARIVLVAEQLCDTADLHAGWRVLDVATGSGNAAIAAARLGCTAVGVDYVPALLERGRLRAAAEGLGRAARRATPRRCRSRTPPSTRSRPSSAPCSPPTTRARPPSCSASAGPAARSPWPAGRRTDSSASSSAPSAPTCRRRPACLTDALGHREPPARALRRRHRLARGCGADVHVAIQVGRGVRRVLPALVRADAEGVRGARGSAREALEHELVALARRSDRLGTDAIAIPPATYLEATAIRAERRRRRMTFSADSHPPDRATTASRISTRRQPLTGSPRPRVRAAGSRSAFAARPTGWTRRPGLRARRQPRFPSAGSRRQASGGRGLGGRAARAPSPSSAARRAASRRVAAPSFVSTAATWCSAVRGETTSRSAISAFVSPSATSASTSSWRAVRPAGFSRVDSRGPCGTRIPSSRMRPATRLRQRLGPEPARDLDRLDGATSSSSSSDSMSARS